MPGIFGIIDNSVREDARALLDAMLNRGNFFPWYVRESGFYPQAALGRIDLGVFPSEPQPISSFDGTVKLVLHGEAHALEEMKGELKLPSDACVGRVMAEGFCLHRADNSINDFFAKIHGRYTVAIWDNSTRRLHLFNDIYGTKPLYYTHVSGRFLFASDLLALFNDKSVSREFDKTGIAQFFTYGQYINNRTSFESIKVLSPRRHLIYSVDTDSVEQCDYQDNFSHSARLDGRARVSDDLWIDSIAEAFYDSVQRRSEDTQNLGVSLSGGLDARSILACIKTNTPQNIVSIAMGISGCGDHRLATQLAQRFGSTHYNYVLNTDFLRDYPRYFEEMVKLTDGQYLSTAIVIPTLDFYRDKNVRVLMRGHAGELMHMTKAYAFSLKEAELPGLHSRQAVLDWCVSHLKSFMLDGVEKPLLKGVSVQEFNSFGPEGLDKSISLCDDFPDAASILWQLFLDMRVHREISLSLKKFGSRVEVRLPFLDKTLHEIMSAAPCSLLTGEAVEKRILERYRSDFLEVKNVNTGTYIGAGKWRQEISHFYQRVMAKLGAPGYQPYERMGLWLRRELKEYVSSLVLSQQNLDGGLFNPDTLRWIIADHNSGANHTYLIVALMVFAQLQKNLEQ